MERSVLTVLTIAVIGGLIAALRFYIGKRTEARGAARKAQIDAMDAAEKAASQPGQM